MPRKAKPDSKTSQLIVQSKTEEEEAKIKAFKEICNREDLYIRDVLFEKITEFLKSHGWPETPGHSQLQISEFSNGPLRRTKNPCCVCGSESKFLVHERGKGKRKYCETHFWEQPLRGERI